MDRNLWSLVEREPYNHYFWTELVRVAEESKNYEGIVRVYSGFLKHFPLLHVYWNKWALIAHQNSSTGSMRDSVDIFEHAVQPGVLEASVEMWQCYCEFVTKLNSDLQEEEIRDILNRAIEKVGSDYQADGIWSIYIHWEDEHQRPENVSSLYAGVLAQPIRNLDTFFQNFTEHAQKHSIERAASAAEKISIDEQLNQEADNDVTLKAADLDRRMTELIYETRKNSYYHSMQLLSRRHFFEVKIRRSYFHFTRPNPSQIANWYEYISFEEQCCADRSPESLATVTHLFERCLIPCQMCADVWIRYAEFLDGFSPEQSKALLDRGKNGLIGRDPEFLRLCGLVEERRGQTAIYDELKNIKSASAKIAVSSFYVRKSVQLAVEDPQASADYRQKAVALLTDYLNATNDPKEYTIIAATLDQMGALTTYNELSQGNCLQCPLSLAIIINCVIKSGEIDLAKRTFERFLVSSESKMSLEDKVKLFPIYIDFLRKNYNEPKIKRLAERQFLSAQKDFRLQKINERREKCKDTTNLSEVMDRWILYLQETDDMKKGSQSATV